MTLEYFVVRLYVSLKHAPLIHTPEYSAMLIGMWEDELIRHGGRIIEGATPIITELLPPEHVISCVEPHCAILVKGYAYDVGPNAQSIL